jgi:hypothetical protein
MVASSDYSLAFFAKQDLFRFLHNRNASWKVPKPYALVGLVQAKPIHNVIDKKQASPLTNPDVSADGRSKSTRVPHDKCQHLHDFVITARLYDFSVFSLQDVTEGYCQG